MANNIFNATEGSGKAMSTETVTTLNGGAVSSRDIQRAAMAMVSGSGVAKDVLPGRQADADSVGVALSTEDVALLTALLTAGTPITGQSLESGGAGALGWFASIRKKIAAFGTAGAPSADVVTVQGITNGTALPITPSISATSRFTSAVVNASSSGNNTLISGTAGQTIRVFAIDLMMAGAVNIKFRDGASTDLSAAQPFYAGGGKVLDPFPSGDPLFVCSTANDFVLNLSAAVAVTGTIWYVKG